MIEVAGIKEIDFQASDRGGFLKHCADAIILTHDHKILMQHRPPWNGRSACLSAFGGHVDEGETISQGLLREIREELGASLTMDEVVKLSTVTEDMTDHTEAVHVYFWHDKSQKITGCYEHSPITFENLAAVLAHPDLMDYAKYNLLKAHSLGLIP